MSNQSEDKKWLIRNNDQIIGPFTENEVKEQLSKGYISPVATACVPGQEFWIFIAAYPEFANYTDITKLTQYTSSLKTGFTKTGTFTGKSTAPGVEKKGEHTSTEQGMPYQIIEENPELRIPVKPKRKSYFFLTAMLVLSIFIVGLFFLFPYPNKHKGEDKHTLSRLGYNHFSVGSYSEALRIWKGESEKNSLSKDDENLFQALQFQLNNELSKAAALVSLGQRQQIPSDEVTKIVQALVQIKTDAWSSARQLLNQLVSDGQSTVIKQSAFANLALTSAKIGKCDFFENYKEDILKNKRLIYFAFSLCLLQLNTLTEDQKNKAEDLLKEITQEPRDYYQEALLGLIYIQLQKGEEVTPVIKKFLDSNPHLTDSYYYNIFIDKKTYSWPDLLPLCEKIYSYNEGHKLFVAFYAYCLARSYRYELAQSFITKATLIDSTDILVKSVQVYITDLVNLKNQSVLILGDVIRSDSDRLYVLPYILQAQFCERAMDWECAFKNWRVVLNNVPDSLSGLGGLAFVKYNQGQYMDARGYVDRGFALDVKTRYSPLLFVDKMLKENKQQE
ncbi:MAG: hypothetical protein OXM55_08045 [Bdellovibrionales bacterium]|nr:hypothetical protein [Bdellovibrionales bacterium]